MVISNLLINATLSFFGSILNILALYCFWKIKWQGSLSNSDKLTLILNVWDTIFCVIFLPVKVITYVLSPEIKVKPTHLAMVDALNVVFSSLIIILIAFNRYIKIIKPVKHHLILSKSCLNKLLFATPVISALIPLTILFDSQLSANF